MCAPCFWKSVESACMSTTRAQWSWELRSSVVWKCTGVHRGGSPLPMNPPGDFKLCFQKIVSSARELATSLADARPIRYEVGLAPTTRIRTHYRCSLRVRRRAHHVRRRILCYNTEKSPTVGSAFSSFPCLRQTFCKDREQ